MGFACYFVAMLLGYYARGRAEINVFFNFGGGSEAKQCFLPWADDSIMILMIILLS